MSLLKLVREPFGALLIDSGACIHLQGPKIWCKKFVLCKCEFAIGFRSFANHHLHLHLHVHRHLHLDLLHLYPFSNSISISTSIVIFVVLHSFSSFT